MFNDTKSIKYNRMFNPYTASTQVNTYYSDKQEDKMPDQQNSQADGKTTVTDGRQDHDNRNEVPETKFTQSKMKSRKGEIGKMSGCISHKPESQGIDQ